MESFYRFLATITAPRPSSKSAGGFIPASPLQSTKGKRAKVSLSPGKHGIRYILKHKENEDFEKRLEAIEQKLSKV